MSEHFTQKVEEYITQLEEHVSRLAKENSDLQEELRITEERELSNFKDLVRNKLECKQIISQLNGEYETCRMALMNMENENHKKLMMFKQEILKKNNINDELHARFKELHAFTVEKLKKRDIKIQQLENEIIQQNILQKRLHEFNNAEQYESDEDDFNNGSGYRSA
jgi:hypothetical protein